MSYNLTRALDALDMADARLTMIEELIGNTTGEIEMSFNGSMGLCHFIRDILKNIDAAKAEIDALRAEKQPVSA